MTPFWQILIGSIAIAICAVGVIYRRRLLKAAKRKNLLNVILIVSFALGGAFGTIFLASGVNHFIRPESDKEEDKDLFSELPFFVFTVEKKCQDPEGKYCTETLFIANKGKGPARELQIRKSPLPDNEQAVLVAGVQKRINKVSNRRISLFGINDTQAVFKERGYWGKNIRLTIRFLDNTNRLFEFKYEGPTKQLRLVYRSFRDQVTGKKVRF